MTPLITVITPTYNNGDTLICTIESVLSQSYPYIQYIISDDASRTFDKNYIEEYISKRNRGNITDLLIICNDKNLGITKNLNSAISHAKGKYIFNVAGDDAFFDGDVLAEWTEVFENTGADVVTARRAVYDADLSEYLYTAPTEEEAEIIKTSSPKELFEFMRDKNLVFGCCTARTKKSYDMMGGYDERYRTIEDYPSNLKLLRMDVPICFWDRTVIRYRSGGISGTGGLSDEYLKESDEIIKNEVLPFTAHPSRAKKDYRRWRNEAVWTRDSKTVCKKLDEARSKAHKLIYYARMFFKHPIMSLEKIGERLTKNGR